MFTAFVKGEETKTLFLGTGIIATAVNRNLKSNKRTKAFLLIVAREPSSLSEPGWYPGFLTAKEGATKALEVPLGPIIVQLPHSPGALETLPWWPPAPF